MSERTEFACLTYKIVVEVGVLDKLGEELQQHVPASRYVVVWDTNVCGVLGERVKKALLCLGNKVLYTQIPPGEAAKTRATKEQIEDFMLTHTCDRNSCVVAVGGGVVGDLSGFVASTYMRGVSFVQVPTTLLAMVDSSIGGKTGLDTPHGKNLVGAFHQPKRVITDPSVLISLPLRQLCNGMAEVIKHAAIQSEQLFKDLESNSDDILSCNLTCLTPIIAESIKIKSEIVQRDERESSLREILNHGHSIGHAIEALLAPEWLHGECVSVGMILETQLSRNIRTVSPDALSRLITCLTAYKLPTKFPPQISAEDILHKMAVDKKNAGGSKRVVLLRCIGDAGTSAESVSDRDVLRVVSNGVEIIPPKKPLQNATIRPPGSKSISNRVLLLAALGVGKCRIRGLLHSDDTQVMINALQSLGVKLTFENNGHDIVVNGCGGKFPAQGPHNLYLGNAGTASRFLTAAVLLAKGTQTVLRGDKRMHERPASDLVDCLKSNGSEIEFLGKSGSLPLRINGNGLQGGKLSVRADVSSQFVSSLLMVAPCAESAVSLELSGEVVSQPYIEMTIKLMAMFGAVVSLSNSNNNLPCYTIPNKGYINPTEFDVESDASSASYPLAIAAVLGGSIKVESVGLASLQGDSAFSRTVLEKMGCKVTQNESNTTVEGPAEGEQLRGIEVDMGDITDTFLTAAVVMATAKPGDVSRITNIANQRVKECNRIAAMVSELKKCGVECRELETGIEIVGMGRQGPKSLLECKKPVPIHCYNDHRVAMSFAVLGCVWPNIMITDRVCVDKTYPTFWDDLCKELNLRDHVIPCSPQEEEAAQGADASSPASLVLIGMRGCGKTTLGQLACTALSMEFVDLDHEIEKTCGCEIKDFVAKNGWDEFRKIEAQTFEKIVATKPTNAIIACGGGIVETETNRTTLAQCGLKVVWIERNIQQIDKYLSCDGQRPAYANGESVEDVYRRRQPWFASLSQYRFSTPETRELQGVKNDFVRFMRVVAGVQKFAVPTGPSYFVSLTLPDLSSQTEDQMKQICEGCCAVELRADLLASLEEDFVCKQVSILRALTMVPIIFTVRSESQGGKFSGSEEQFWQTLTLALRLGCEVVDVESCWSEGGRKAFLQRTRNTAVSTIGSFHSKAPCSGSHEFQAVFRACHSVCGLHFDVVKIVFSAQRVDDCYVLRSALADVAQQFSGQQLPPTIVLAMGAQGKLSRVLNTTLTPITHPSLSAAAPGQMSLAEIQSARTLLGLV